MSTSDRPRTSIYATRLQAFADVASDGPANERHRGRWREMFAGRIGPAFDGRILLEVGCADAALLCRVAATHPRTAFVGIDWKFRAIHAAATRVAAGGLRNVMLLRGRAQSIAACFAAGEVDDAWLFHPEPCERAVERPNRLLAAPFLLALHAALRDATSTVTIKTDHAEYFASTLAVVAAPTVASRFAVTETSGDYWRDADLLRRTASRPYAGETTRYEDRFVKRKQPIHFLELRKRELYEASR